MTTLLVLFTSHPYLSKNVLHIVILRSCCQLHLEDGLLCVVLGILQFVTKQISDKILSWHEYGPKMEKLPALLDTTNGFWPQLSSMLITQWWCKTSRKIKPIIYLRVGISGIWGIDLQAKSWIFLTGFWLIQHWASTTIIMHHIIISTHLSC